MKTVRDLPVEGRRVLVRADLNVPLDGARITDDTRIRASLPTIRYLRDHGAEVIVCSHLGRPKGEVRPELSLRPVADRLAELLGEPVAFDGEAGPVRLLENLRFDPREEKNDPALAAELASLADLFVSDAFGTVHRAHASTVGVAHLLPSAAGLLLAAELEAFARILESPEHPFVVVIGGAKVADKIGVIDRFTGLADAVLVGGAMAFTFLAARGVAVGASKHEDADGQEVARRAMADAGERGCELVLPSDVVIAERVEADAPTQVVAADAIPMLAPRRSSRRSVETSPDVTRGRRRRRDHGAALPERACAGAGGHAVRRRQARSTRLGREAFARAQRKRRCEWIAGALVVLAVAVVAAALIVAHSQRTVNVNLDGQLETCTTQSFGSSGFSSDTCFGP